MRPPPRVLYKTCLAKPLESVVLTTIPELRLKWKEHGEMLQALGKGAFSVGYAAHAVPACCRLCGWACAAHASVVSNVSLAELTTAFQCSQCLHPYGARLYRYALYKTQLGKSLHDKTCADCAGMAPHSTSVLRACE